MCITSGDDDDDVSNREASVYWKFCNKGILWNGGVCLDGGHFYRGPYFFICTIYVFCTYLSLSRTFSLAKTERDYSFIQQRRPWSSLLIRL